MSRAVTADHVLFNECISAFRPNGKQHFRFGDGPSCSYLLTSFHLTEKWQLPNCTIYPSVRVHLPGANSAFICKVQNPDWCDTHNSHLYGVALSSIVTFASGRPCKSTRDDYLCRGENLTESDALEISLVHPILTAGPGCMHTSLAAITLQKYQEELADLITSLHELPYSIYVILMQAIRLVHLSLLTKRDDFGLAYLLVISAIESVAQCAIKRKDVKQNHPNEAAWSKRAQEDQDFSNLLSAYKDARGKNQYLSERYVTFINKFAPATDWERVVPHPHQDLADYIEDLSPMHGVNNLVKKHWLEKYPADLSEEEIGVILANSYKHRSSFIHRGEQPPHREPASSNRFFQEHREYDGASITEWLIPNYELLIGIAQSSIRNWMKII